MVSLPNLNTFITSTSTSIQRPRITRSSVVVTLAGPSSSSSLKIMDHSLRYASPCLWNQLSLSLRQPHFSTSSSISDSPIPSPITSSSFNAPSFVTPSLFRSPLKTYLFHKSYPSPPRSFTSFSRSALTDYCLGCFFWATWFLPARS